MELYAEKKMEMDYDVLEQNDVQELANQAYTGVFQGRGLQDSITVFMTFLIHVFGFIMYGTLLMRQNVILILMILLSESIIYVILNFARKKEKGKWPLMSEEIRKTEYITNQASSLAAGKDIRLFQMATWFMKEYRQSVKKIGKVSAATQNWYFTGNAAEVLFAFIRNSAAYIFLIILVLDRKIEIAELVFYIAVVNGCSVYLNGIIKCMNSFGIISMHFGFLRRFMEIKSKWSDSSGLGTDKINEIKKGTVEIELRNVTFTFPASEKQILKNFNLTLKAGEKLALIGLNGAGKTTIVKLLCGFYQPDSGQVLVNGIDRKKFSREEYYSLVAVLFQDNIMLPITLKENIASLSSDKINNNKLEKVLEEADALEKYKQLKKKGNSLLVKEINCEAVEFSGGEKQKFLFARALYKEAPFIILDEPTAALDPVAEKNLYMNFEKAMSGKTVLFISHRLSSTRFCDRIVLLENGEIAETGTHTELIRKKGKYCKLYNIQSKYYQEKKKQDDIKTAYGL